MLARPRPGLHPQPGVPRLRPHELSENAPAQVPEHHPRSRGAQTRGPRGVLLHRRRPAPCRQPAPATPDRALLPHDARKRGLRPRGAPACCLRGPDRAAEGRRRPDRGRRAGARRGLRAVRRRARTGLDARVRAAARVRRARALHRLARRGGSRARARRCVGRGRAVAVARAVRPRRDRGVRRRPPGGGQRDRGIPDWLQHGTSGLAVPPGDAGALASALTELLADPARQHAMGLAGRAHVERLYSADRHVQILLGGYETARARWSESSSRARSAVRPRLISRS